jgi:hypothetical protein
MPRVLPSEAVAAFDRMFPFLTDAVANPNIAVNHVAALNAIVALVDQIPGELMTLNGPNFARLIEKRARIQGHVADCTARGVHANPFPGIHIRTLRNLLAVCPDQTVPAAIATLPFVANPQLREALRADIASVESSLRDSDWKPATVIAGSVIELCCWTRYSSSRPPQSSLQPKRSFRTAR